MSWRRRLPRRFGARLGGRVRRHPWLATLLAVPLALALVLAILWLTLPDPGALATGWPAETAYMELRREQAAEEGRELRIDYRPVPLSRVPRSLERAVLVAEDAGFHGHQGFDWHEVRDAFSEAWEERRLPRGASTITQQLARNLYLSPSRNPLRKLREAMLTRRLEETLSKRRILELYLNVIELGPGTFGVQAASRRYFGKDVSALGPREAAQIAATIPAPRTHNPATGTRTFRWRTDLVYRRTFGRPEERIEVDVPEPEVAPPDLSAPGEGPPPAIDTVPAVVDTAPDPTHHGPRRRPTAMRRPHVSCGVMPPTGGLRVRRAGPQAIAAQDAAIRRRIGSECCNLLDRIHAPLPTKGTPAARPVRKARVSRAFRETAGPPGLRTRSVSTFFTRRAA